MFEAHLAPPSYYSQDEFKKEQLEILAQTWAFACYAFELPNLNDFKVISRFEQEIVLQNTREGIKAFRNVCPHRFSKIQLEQKGNRGLICPYHGWSFSASGRLAGLPRKETFEQPDEMRNRICLHQFSLEFAGELIFVQVNEGMSFDQYFGHRADFLKDVGRSLDVRIDSFEGDIAANWKILIENSLEGYHVPMIHAETIAKFQGMSKSAGAVNDFVADEATVNLACKKGSSEWSKVAHSHMVNLAEDKWLEKFMKIAKGAGSWPLALDGYIHQLFFPNLTITSFLGYSFHIQYFEPLAAEKTRVHSSIFKSKFIGGNESLRKMMFEPMYQENVKFTHLVFREDEGITSAVQAGCKLAPRHARSVFSSLEHRIWAFQQTFKTLEMRLNGN